MTLKEQLIQYARECAESMPSQLLRNGDLDRYINYLDANYENRTTIPCPECWMYGRQLLQLRQSGQSGEPQYIKPCKSPAYYEGEEEPDTSSDYWRCGEKECGFKCEVKKEYT